MKYLSEQKALEKLHNLKSNYQQEIKSAYEHKSKSCLNCETKGACCLDAHFVNVHITRLEAAAIRKTLSKLPESAQQQIKLRIDETIEKYGLNTAGDTFSKTFACPLFEKSTGCLVHHEGKPLPCITHACYENKADLPPDLLQTEQEIAVSDLNRKTYGADAWWLPLPVAISRNRG